MSIKNLWDKKLSLDKSAFLDTTIDLLEYIYNKKRYKNIKVNRIEKSITNNIQFRAISFRYMNNLIIFHEGTNNAMYGWIENFKLVSFRLFE